MDLQSQCYLAHCAYRSEKSAFSGYFGAAAELSALGESNPILAGVAEMPHSLNNPGLLDSTVTERTFGLPLRSTSPRRNDGLTYPDRPGIVR